MRFLVLQHHPDEHPGVFRTFMKDAGIEWDAVELDAGEAIPDIAAYDALLSMGGPMDVWEVEENPWLADEKDLIRSAVGNGGLPFLGVCLGHQLLADALGGTVVKMDDAEVGIHKVHLTEAGKTDLVLGALSPTIESLQWHGVSVIKPPKNGVSLAESPVCPVQALRVGDRAYGIQFHVEVTDKTVGEWAIIPAYKRALDKALGEGGADRLNADTAARLEQFNQDAKTMFDAFLSVVKG